MTWSREERTGLWQERVREGLAAQNPISTKTSPERFHDKGKQPKDDKLSLSESVRDTSLTLPITT